MEEKLTPRLACVAGFVPQGACLADIGTDHAHLPVSLIRQGRVKRAIASDIRQGPVEIARRNVARAGLSDKISVRLGAGLDAISPTEADCVAIAGMGGETIVQILEEADAQKKRFSSYIFQPMSMAEKLREYLQNHGFSIKDEKLAREGEKCYVILSAMPEDGMERANQAGSDEPFYFYIGRRLIENRDPLLGQFLERKIRAHTKTLAGMRQAKSVDAAVYSEFEGRLLRMKALYEETKTW